MPLLGEVPVEDKDRGQGRQGDPVKLRAGLRPEAGQKEGRMGRWGVWGGRVVDHMCSHDRNVSASSCNACCQNSDYDHSSVPMPFAWKS